MKSYETTVLPLYVGILEDAAARWPDVRRSTERDLFRLSKAIKDRGIEYLTLLLPSVRHWFDKSLDEGCLLDESKIPRGMRIYRGRPLLFAGILDKIFDDDGMLRKSADPWMILCYRTLLSVCGKLEVPPKEATLHKSVKEFCNVEDTLCAMASEPIWAGIPSQPNGNYEERSIDPGRSLGRRDGGSSSVPKSETVYHRDYGNLYSRDRVGYSWDTFRQLCRRVVSELGDFDPYALIPKHGPGAVAERGVVDKYDFTTWSEPLDRAFPTIGTVAAVFCLHRTQDWRKAPHG
jgi:hypothetical protein